ncbi:MAG: TonB-dependent receptor [Xanthobacteraceae bacterium]|nr:TonB-dependent receptor [Xanthobacteraceae bacterium]
MRVRDRSPATACLFAGGICFAFCGQAQAQASDRQTAAAQQLPAITVTSPPGKPKHVPRGKPAETLQSATRAARQRGPQATANQSTGSGGPHQGEPPSTSNAAASATTVSGAEINAMPWSRPGEVLEVVPGLIVTQHSGEGKANQYFLRGFNLDHGTDFAIFVDDMPVNMRTHAHGQGYADLNFLIPELVGSIDIKKGPYYADEGDFASVGAAHISLTESLRGTLASVTAGSFNYKRFLGITSQQVGAGNLLIAGEVYGYDGPWDHPDDARKFNGIVRYNQGTRDDGFSLTAMAYSNKWNSSDQIPERAIESGEIGLYGELDPTDGGRSDRFSLSGKWAHTSDYGLSKANFYVIKSALDLWNDFTFFLDNPANGDQFHQHDDRILGGVNASHQFGGSFAGLPMETEIGLQSRYDDIKLALTNTVARQFLSNIRSDKVQEGSVGLYVQNTVHWTDWMRTYVGYRGDFYTTSVDSMFNAANSGNANAAIGSPKAGIVFGPFAKTEFYINAGEGFHSNDARGVTATKSPVTGDPLSSSPFLVRTKGAEVGVRSKIIPNLESTFSVFVLDSASEIVFSGDAGDTEASRPSRRYGFEWTNRYHPLSWLSITGDLAMTHARFKGFDAEQAALYDSLAGFPQVQIGNAPGNYIPGSPDVVASASIRLGEAKGLFTSLRYSYFGPRPLTEDRAFVSPATGLLNGQVGYKFDNGWQIKLEGFNLTDSRSDQITYAYGSLIKSDALFGQCFPTTGLPTAPAAVCANGVMDSVLHPVEPLAVRLTIAGRF